MGEKIIQSIANLSLFLISQALAKKNINILFNLQALSIINTSLSATENIRRQDVQT